MAVKNSDELRKVQEALQPKIVQTYQKLGQSKVIYEALTNMKKSSNLWSTMS
jgi:Zn-dependent oligopeptidase